MVEHYDEALANDYDFLDNFSCEKDSKIDCPTDDPEFLYDLWRINDED